jgi:arylsulfatase A-like enzyme
MLFEHKLQPIFVKACLDKHQGLPNGVADLFGNGHRSWFFEDLWRTPMILAGPGIPAGKRVKSLSANLDVFPTILEALNLPRTPWLEGESHFGGGETLRERVQAYAYQTSVVREKQGLKLVQHPRMMYLLPEPGELPVDLYDLARDPYEEKSLSDERPEEARRLRAEIDAWHARSKRDASTTMTQEQLDALRANGYVDIGK